jgi:hypothetical protein
VQVDCARFRFAEKMVLHSSRPGIEVSMRLITSDQAAVFGFDADDSIHGDISFPRSAEEAEAVGGWESHSAFRAQMTAIVRRPRA